MEFCRQIRGSNWIWIPVLGVGFFFLYYFTFKFLILKFNYLTPGRELEEDMPEVQEAVKSDDIIGEIITGLGGADNVVSVDACFTRLRIKVKDKSVVQDVKFWKSLGASGVVQVSDGVQIVYGTKADVYKTQIRGVLGME